MVNAAASIVYAFEQIKGDARLAHHARTNKNVLDLTTVPVEVRPENKHLDFS